MVLKIECVKFIFCIVQLFLKELFIHSSDFTADNGQTNFIFRSINSWGGGWWSMERVIKIVTVVGNYIRQMMTVNMMNLIYTTHPFWVDSRSSSTCGGAAICICIWKSPGNQLIMIIYSNCRTSTITCSCWPWPKGWVTLKAKTIANEIAWLPGLLTAPLFSRTYTQIRTTSLMTGSKSA